MAQPPQSGLAAPPRGRRRRALLWICVLAGALFLVLAVLARRHPYFPFDLAVTRELQRHHEPALYHVMFVATWLGFQPQAFIGGAAAVLALLVLRRWWEAACLLFASCAVFVLNLAKTIVQRERPTPDLVDVLSPLSSMSFPSGHATQFTAFGGFLFFLIHARMAPSWARTALLAVVGLVLAAVGPSRVYFGQHWPSDVIAGYLLGGLWLVLSIGVYRLGLGRWPARATKG